MKSFVYINMRLIIAIALPLSVGLIGALFVSEDSRLWYSNRVKQPPWSPPGWVFSVVWTLLYTAMGYGSYRIYEAKGRRAASNVLSFYCRACTPSDPDREERQAMRLRCMALVLFGTMLTLNFCWTPIFFFFRLPVLAFWWSLILTIVTALLAIVSLTVDATAAGIFFLLLFWSVFATVLNSSIVSMNDLSFWSIGAKTE